MTKIRDARLNTGLTQQEVSDKIGIPKRTLENYEQGSRNPAPWVENLLIEKIKTLGGKEMLVDRIRKMLDKEIMDKGIMGTETASVTLELTAEEKEQFQRSLWREFNEQFYDWQFEGNELTMTWCEDGFWTKKYNLYKWEEEVKKFEDITPGCAILSNDSCPVLVRTFDAILNAVAAVASRETEICKEYTNTGYVYKVTEYWVDSEWVDQYGDIRDRIETEAVSNTELALERYKAYHNMPGACKIE